MFKSKMMVLALTATGVLLTSGCLSLKWVEMFTQWGFNASGILDNFGVIKG